MSLIILRTKSLRRVQALKTSSIAKITSNLLLPIVETTTEARIRIDMVSEYDQCRTIRKKAEMTRDLFRDGISWPLWIFKRVPLDPSSLHASLSSLSLCASFSSLFGKEQKIHLKSIWMDYPIPSPASLDEKMRTMDPKDDRLPKRKRPKHWWINGFRVHLSW